MNLELIVRKGGPRGSQRNSPQPGDVITIGGVPFGVVGPDGGVTTSAGNVFIDHSVNEAWVKPSVGGGIEFIANKLNTGQVAGNFNGGGIGNKPIAGIPGFEGLHISELPVIDSEVHICTDSDADEERYGVYYNVLLDLGGTGVGPYAVMSIAQTLGGRIDKYGETGAPASVTDFDINDFQVLDPSPGGVDYQNKFNPNYFFIVGNLFTYQAGTNRINDSWTSNPIKLDILLNGGTMDNTNAVFVGGFPNCKIHSMICPPEISDGGHPAGIKLAGLMAGIGDSATVKRSVTYMSELYLNGVKYL